MSELFDKDQNNIETSDVENINDVTKSDVVDEAESTIFSAPLLHKDKEKKNGKKKLISIIAACVAVAVLAGGTLAVIKLIPEMTDDETVSSVFEDISVVDADSKTFTNVTITNEHGEFKFISQELASTDEDGNSSTQTYWSIDGIDIKKLSNTSVDSLISSVASITASRKIESKTPSECGFDNPRITVSVQSNGSDAYTLFVGDASTDGYGSYLMLEGDDTIYVADDAEFESFNFELLDLSDKTSIPATIFSADTSENKNDSGVYAYFDSLTISGELYPEKVTIVNNNADTDSAALLQYIITTPMKRYADADKLVSLVNMFSSEITVAGNYAFDITDKTLADFGLDNPDAIVTMTIDGESKTFNISQIDDDYCAVTYDGATMIRKVLSSNFAFLGLKTENLYYKNMFMNSINDITNLTIKDSETEIKFDISYEEDENSNKTYFIKANGQDLVAENFQNFYADFVGIQCSDYSTEKISAKADATVTFTFNDNSTSVIEFYKSNDTQYQYSIDGIDMGKITSSAFNKMLKNVKSVAAGEKFV